jgi:hypothetical protein
VAKAPFVVFQLVPGQSAADAKVREEQSWVLGHRKTVYLGAIVDFMIEKNVFRLLERSSPSQTGFDGK